MRYFSGFQEIARTKVKSESKDRGLEMYFELAPLKSIDKQGRFYNEKNI